MYLLSNTLSEVLGNLLRVIVKIRLFLSKFIKKCIDSIECFQELLFIIFRQKINSFDLARSLRSGIPRAIISRVTILSLLNLSYSTAENALSHLIPNCFKLFWHSWCNWLHHAVLASGSYWTLNGIYINKFQLLHELFFVIVLFGLWRVHIIIVKIVLFLLLLILFSKDRF